MKKILLTTGLIISLLIITAATASASENEKAVGNFTIHPTYMHGENTSWIILDAYQNSTLRDYVTLENLTAETQTISLNATDAEESGNSYLIKDSKNPEGFISWIKFEKTEYTLAPGQKIRVPFEINIPASAEINEYSGAILASQAHQGDSSLTIVTRIGVRFYLNVVAPGAHLSNTISQTATVSAPFGAGSFAGNLYFILTSLALAAVVIYTINGQLNKRKYAKT